MSDSFNFHYREVGYGTSFEPVNRRREATKREKPEQLFENEFVVDVGSACLGWDGEIQMIFDHHFERENNYPSAAAAVVHHIPEIEAYASKLKAEGVTDFWLVAHAAPDFDCLAARYLVRMIICGSISSTETAPAELRAEGDMAIACVKRATFGLSPDGWIPYSEAGGEYGCIDWRNPNFEEDIAGVRQPVVPKNRWPILIAAYASAVDQSWALKSPIASRPHAVLYMAVERRVSSAHANQGTKFFNFLKERMVQDELTPLYDSLFEGDDGGYSAELALLRRDFPAYQRDVARARKCFVSVPYSDRPFREWFEKVENVPLLNDKGETQVKHLKIGKAERRKCDGIFIRDPESVLFKEWARTDEENSSSGKGFLFTAVCYSNGRPNSKTQNTDWFVLSLDPERAKGCHLYPLWARLQAAEMETRKACPNGLGDIKGEKVRDDMAGRKVGPDPWFDGNSFQATIIDVPNRGILVPTTGDGQLLPVSTSRGVSSTPTVESILRRELETRWFSDPDAAFDLIIDYSPDGEAKDYCECVTCPIWESGGYRLENQALRFAQIELAPAVTPFDSVLAAQIGRQMWSVIEIEGVSTVPIDFEERHLIASESAIVVWNRRGIVVGYIGEGGREYSETVKRWLSSVHSIRIKADRLLLDGDSGDYSDLVPTESQEVEKLLKEVVKLQREAVRPQGKVLRRFLEATHFEGFIRSLYEWNQGKTMAGHLHSIKHTQENVEWVEIFLVSVYAIYFAYYLGSAFEFNGMVKGWGIILMSISAFIIAFVKIAPYRKPELEVVLKPLRSELKFLSIVGFAISLLLAYLIIGWLVPK